MYIAKSFKLLKQAPV